MSARDALRFLQAPLKERYRDDAGRGAGHAHRRAASSARASPARSQTGRALAEAGLHPATGGDGTLLCSGDMLLEALVACAGVTLRAVAPRSASRSTAARVHAEGDLDFRGTLGVDKDAPVGFRAIRLSFDLDTDADEEQLATLLKLTERYCVVLQTLAGSPALETELSTSSRQ